MFHGGDPRVSSVLHNERLTRFQNGALIAPVPRQVKVCPAGMEEINYTILNLFPVAIWAASMGRPKDTCKPSGLAR